MMVLRASWRFCVAYATTATLRLFFNRRSDSVLHPSLVHGRHTLRELEEAPEVLLLSTQRSI